MRRGAAPGAAVLVHGGGARKASGPRFRLGAAPDHLLEGR